MKSGERYYLIGKSLKHSYSKIIHKKIGGYRYDLKNLSPEELDSFMREKNFSGINVTMPYKLDVLPYCDVFGKAVVDIGSANTIVKNLDGSLYADNTDYKGLIYLIKKSKINIRGKNVLIMGTGGTSLTAHAVARNLGAKKIYVVSRTGSINYRNVYAIKNIEVIINTTPVGMFPNNYDRLLIDIRRFANLEAVIDVVYNPLKTQLIKTAEDIGVNATGGLSMLVAQAVYSAELFSGNNKSVRTIERIDRELSRELTNIVFIGMPGSGKTTLAKIVSRKLGRKYIDIDKYIVSKENKSIPTIFEESGERYFRSLERESIKQVAKSTGLVIATGGGAIINSQNMFNLKQNGLVFFVDRDTNSLSTKGRPLSSSTENIQKLYSERIDLYNNYSDFIINNNENGIVKIADRIVEVYNENFSN